MLLDIISAEDWIALQVTEGQASQLLHLLSVLTLDGSSGNSYAATLHLPLQFVQVARPTNFHSFASFKRWQSTTRGIIVQGLLDLAVKYGNQGGTLKRHTVRTHFHSSTACSVPVPSPEQH
jgi:hypothetical protein